MSSRVGLSLAVARRSAASACTPSLQAAALRTPLKSKYSTLQGTPLPLSRAGVEWAAAPSAEDAGGGGGRAVLRALAAADAAAVDELQRGRRSTRRRGCAAAGAGRAGDAPRRGARRNVPADAAGVPGWHHHNHTTCADRFTLLLAADMDVASRDPEHGRWRFCSAAARCASGDGGFHLEWIDEVPLTSALNAGGCGMELSELVWCAAARVLERTAALRAARTAQPPPPPPLTATAATASTATTATASTASTAAATALRYDGALLACDDRTGVLYEIRGGVPIPAHILSDGDGRQVGSTFKCEWAAVRHGLLYVGGVGMEWAGEGSAHDRPQWVMTLDGGGQPEHYNWTASYEALRDAAGCSRPGYLWHEAAVWHDATERWLFMPRRASAEAWEEEADETRGTNLMLWAEGPARAPPAAAARRRQPRRRRRRRRLRRRRRVGAV